MQLNRIRRKLIVQGLSNKKFDKRFATLNKREHAIGDTVYDLLITPAHVELMASLPIGMVELCRCIEVAWDGAGIYQEMSVEHLLPYKIFPQIPMPSALHRRISRVRASAKQLGTDVWQNEHNWTNTLHNYTTVEKLLASYPLWKSVVNKALETTY